MITQATSNLGKSLTPKEILQEVEAYLIGRWTTDLANTSALLFQHFPNINWVGFYLTDLDPSKKTDTLWLGPFQGLPACTEIAFGKGVCGTAAATRMSQLVMDVDSFPGHIACDSRSKSEVVVPMIANQKVIGVLDVDSAELGRFSREDVLFFETIVQLLLAKNNSFS